VGGRGLGGRLEQRGDGVRERDRVDRVLDDRLGPRPACKPGVVAAGDEQYDGRRIVDLVLDLARDAHPAARGGLAVEDHQVHPALVQPGDRGPVGIERDRLDQQSRLGMLAERPDHPVPGFGAGGVDEHGEPARLGGGLLHMANPRRWAPDDLRRV
jgi:hypothetical protein